MRIAASLALLTVCLSGGIALAEVTVPPPVATPTKITTVVVPTTLASAIQREQVRVNSKLTTDQRSKVTAASKTSASAIATQLKAGKTVTPTAALAIARKSAGDPAIDFANLPIEDLVMAVMAAIARDAEQDLRQALEEMKTANQRKAAIREQMAGLKEADAKARESLRSQYDQAAALESQAQERAIAARSLHAKAIDTLATLPQIAPPDAGASK